VFLRHFLHFYIHKFPHGKLSYPFRTNFVSSIEFGILARVPQLKRECIMKLRLRCSITCSGSKTAKREQWCARVNGVTPWRCVPQNFRKRRARITCVNNIEEVVDFGRILQFAAGEKSGPLIKLARRSPSMWRQQEVTVCSLKFSTTFALVWLEIKMVVCLSLMTWMGTKVKNWFCVWCFIWMHEPAFWDDLKFYST
jgi:hypothetical protein